MANTPATIKVNAVSARHGETRAAASLVTASDADGDSVTQYQFYDVGVPGAGLFVNGVGLANGQLVTLSLTQFAQTVYHSGSGTDTLAVRAWDGTQWSDFTVFTVDAPVDQGLTLTAPSLPASHGESFAALNLVTATDADGDTASLYQIYEAGAPGAGFLSNGALLPSGQLLTLTAAQFAAAAYRSGSGPDIVAVRAYDGYIWSPFSVFTVDAPADHAPVLTGASQVSASHGRSFAVSSLVTATDADHDDTISQYQFYDVGIGGAHLVTAGAAQPAGAFVTLSAAQFAQTAYRSGAGTDTLVVRGYDGYLWSDYKVIYVTAPPDQPAVLTPLLPSFTATHGETFAASSLVSTSDPEDDPIVAYQFYDVGSPGAALIGTDGALPSGQLLTLTAAQFAQTIYRSGSGTDTLAARAYDGYVWGQFAVFTVTAPPDAAPSIAAQSIPAAHGHTFAGLSLISITDKDSDAITQYQLYEVGAPGAAFLTNGVALPTGALVTLSAADFAQTTYRSGAGTDTLVVRANDGYLWSPFAVFQVTGPPDAGLTLSTPNQTEAKGQTVAFSSLFTASDPDGDSLTQLQLYEVGVPGAQLVVNGHPHGSAQFLTLSAADLAQTTYQAGSGKDVLALRANDGYVWGPWALLNVTGTPPIAINAIDGNDILNAAQAQNALAVSGTSSSVAGQTVTLSFHGKSYSGTVANDGTWSVAVPVSALTGTALPDGKYTVIADVTDQFGTQGEAKRTLTVQETPPLTPTLIIAPADQTGAATQTQAATVTLTGHTSPNEGVTLSSGQHTLSNNSGNFQIANVPLALGDNALTVQVTDFAGNASSFTAHLQRQQASGARDVSVEWIETALKAIKADASDPDFASRALAMESLAVYDAVSAIDGTPGYLVNMTAPAGANATAAAAQAAHDVLAWLFPDQKTALDNQLASDLAAIADGQGKSDGTALGKSVAAKIIALRVNDGWNLNILDNGSTAVGRWRPTAPGYLPSLNPQWANLLPFAMTSPSQFDPAGPPDLTSQAFADAFNKTKSLGAANSSTRTADQTDIANFWKDGIGTYTPAGQWNDIAAQIAQAQGNSLAQNARLFAELNVAQADAAIAAWNTKYGFSTWRPDTAIQNANQIGNAGIAADPSWQPLIIDPNFPEYVSGHSTFSAAAADILSSFFGASYGFSYTDSALGSLPGTTRNYTSFSQAAQEAGESRIYGGIHFEFSNQDGLATGQKVGDWVLKAFDNSQDTTPPQIVLDQASGLVTNKALTLTGTVTDNLSGPASLTAQLDGGAAQAVALSSSGAFSFPTGVAVNGSADGQHTLVVVATDAAGNTGAPLSFTWTIDTQPPALTLAAGSIQDGGALTSGSHLTGTANPTGSTLGTLVYFFDATAPMPISRDAASGAFDQALDLSKLGAGSHTLTVIATDGAGNSATKTLHVSLPSLIPLMVTDLMPMAGAQDVGVTYRPEVMFSRPVQTSTLTSTSFFATDSTGAVLPATIVPNADATAAWLFFSNPMPGGSTVALHVQGEKIKGTDGTLLDAAGTGTAGSDLTESFSTVSTAAVPGTTITGKVVDTGPDGTPMTPDDVKAAADGLADYANDTWKLPIEHVKVFVLGHEDQAAYTDSSGNFTLTDVPTGDVKVVINGNTATNAPSGFYFPEMVMDTTVRAGLANTIMGSMGLPAAQDASAGNPAVYLPRVATSVLTPISNSAPTNVTLQSVSALGLTSDQSKLVSLNVLPGSLIGPDGNPIANGSVGISMVAPALIQDMLPNGLKVAATLTIQAPGVAKFATPLTLTLPNIYGAAPGEKVFTYSYDHTTGQAVFNGTATVSTDGLTVTTDPGSGITMPGWSAGTPSGTFGSGGGNGPCGGPPPSLDPPPDTPDDTEHESDPIVEPTIYGDGSGGSDGEFKLSWTSPDKLPDTPPPPPPPGGACPPARPKDPPNEHQPYIDVTIEVDGKLKDYMEQKGDLDLTSQSFTLQAGSGETKTFEMVAKSYDDMFSGGLESVPNDILYGSEIKVTEVTGNSDGSKHTEISKYDLFRFVAATNPPGDDNKTLDLGANRADGSEGQQEQLELNTGDAVRPVSVSDDNDQFSVDLNGGTMDVTAELSDASPNDVQTGPVTAELKNGKTAQLFQTKALGRLDQHVYVNTDSLITLLQQLRTQINYFVWVATQTGEIKRRPFGLLDISALPPPMQALIRNLPIINGDVGAIARKVAQGIYDFYSRFTPRIKPEYNAGASNTVTIDFTTQAAGVYKDQNDGTLAHSTIDHNDSLLNDAIDFNNDLNSRTRYKMLDEALNTKTLSAFHTSYQDLIDVYPVQNLDKGSVGGPIVLGNPSTTTTSPAEFINNLIHSGVHETGHTLGLDHTKSNTDVMTPSMWGQVGDFEVTIEAARMALGFPYTPDEAELALDYYANGRASPSFDNILGFIGNQLGNALGFQSGIFSDPHIFQGMFYGMSEYVAPPQNVLYVVSITVPQTSTLNTGQSVQLTLTMSGPVTLDTANGVPFLLLSDGGIATYASAASDTSSGKLVFNYTAGPRSYATDLTVIGVNTNSATVQGTNGINVDLSGVAQYELHLPVNIPVIANVNASQSSGDLSTGQRLVFTVTMSEGVTVDTTAGSPTLSLSDGSSATYDGSASNPPAGTLVFDHTVGANDYSADLNVLSLNLNGATIQDAAGGNADLSGAVGSNVGVDVNAAVVTGVSVSSTTAEVNSGDTVSVTITLNEGVTVNTTGGKPTLNLYGGGGGIYDQASSRPSAGVLVFSYTVGESDRTPKFLANDISLNGATIDDGSGHPADFSGLSNFPTSLQVGSAFVFTVMAAQSGDVATGQTVELTVTMSEGVVVNTTSGSPKLALSNGATAAYNPSDSDPAAGKLVFKYTVGLTDYSPNLAVLRLDTNGATIEDANDQSADLSGAVGPTLGVAVNSVIVTDVRATPQAGELVTGQRITLSVTLSGAVVVDTAAGFPTLDLGGGGVATYDAAASNPSAGTLVFDYRVGGTDRTSRLSANQFNLNGATVEDTKGNPADLSAVSTFATNLQVAPAYVTSVAAVQLGGISSGQIAQVIVAISEGVTVDTTNGAPTLGLSDGASATYDATASNPFTGTLAFEYLVGASDYTSDLKVLGADLNGATIKDPNGVEVDLSSVANVDLGLTVNAASVTAVTLSPQTGESDAGQTMTLMLTFNKGVTVNTTGGSPSLHLDDGAIATYDANASIPSAGNLVFNYTVRASDETQNLQIAQFNLNGAVITDANGNAADLTSATTFATNFQIGPVFVDGLSAAQSGDVDTGQTVQLTVDISGGVTVNIAGSKPTLSLSDGAVATYDVTASQPSAGALVFDYTVGASDYSTDLKVIGFNRNGATITDANGIGADLSGTPGFDLALDVNAAIVTGVTTSPQIGEVSAGQKVTVTLTMSTGVTVNTAGGAPTLTLNDAALATFDANASKPSAGIFAFDYTVGPTDQTADLYVTKVNLNGATVTGTSGHPADFAAVSNFVSTLQVGAGPLGLSEDATGSPVGSSYHIGPVILNQSKRAVLDLQNLGSVNLVLNALKLTDPTSSFSISSIAPGTIVAPGASIPLDVTFDPHSVGQSTATIEVDTNEPSGPTKIKLTGAGESPTPYANVTPSNNNNFGGVAVGNAAQQNKLYTITNDGAGPLLISAISVDDTNDFTLTGLPGNLSSTRISLAYGQTFSFGASFHPRNGGLDAGFITIATNDPAHPTIRVDAVGTGLDPSNKVHWGNDYVAIEAGQGTLYAKSDASGAYNFFLPAKAKYHEAVFDPQSGLLGTDDGTTGASGTGTDLAYNLLFHAAYAQDTSYDGLPDDIKFAIGLSPTGSGVTPYGISDYAAIKAGLNPLASRLTATGILATLQLQGQATGLVLQGSLADPSKQTAYVTTGSYGLAIVDVSDYQKPVVVGQLRMEGGTATSVGVDPLLGLAAVADGAYGAANDSGGLRIVNIADPTAPKLVQTIHINPSVVQVVEGILYTNDGAVLQAYDLATGEKLQEISPAGGAAIGSIVHDGTMLYTMDANRTLRIFDIGSGTMTARGSLPLNFGDTDKLFAADGVVYVGAEARAVNTLSNGYATVDVSNPDSPHLISAPANGIASRTLALNGSGLGVGAGSEFANSHITPSLDVFSTADPGNTGQFVTRYLLPELPSDVQIGGGIAFVADGGTGLEVVNYQAFDTKNVPPSIAVTQLPADVDPNTAGIQVTEGSIVSLKAKINDDVQVRNVALLLNGKIVKNDVTYPFDLSAAMPSLAANGSSQVTLQIQATDTGGNTTTSAPIALTLVRDSTPPQIVNQNVAENALEGATFRTLIYTFSKPLDLTTVNASTFTLTGPGGTAIAPVSIEPRIGNEVVQVTHNPLGQGQYHAGVTTGVKDTAGIALAHAVTTDFSIQVYSVHWSAATGGNWSTASNWSTGVVPISTDDVLIDLPGQTVTIDQNVLISAISSNAMLTTGGSYTVHVTSSASLAGATVNPGGPWNEALLFDGPTSIGSLTLRDIASVLGGSGNVTVTGTLDWGSNSWPSVMTGTGTTLLASNATATLSGWIDIDRELDIAGQATLTANTVDVGREGGTPSSYPVSGKLSILAGGVLNISDSVNININGNGINGNTNGNVFENAGMLNKAGTGTTTIGLVSFANDASGVVNVQTGTLSFQGGGTNAGTMNTAANAVLQFGGNAFTMGGSSAVNAAGDLFVAGTTVTAAGSLSIAGTLHLQNGTLNFSNALNPASLLINNSGVLNSTAGVTTGSVTIVGGGPLFGDGNLDGTANVMVTGSADWQAWSGMSGAGKTTIASGATLNLNLVNGSTGIWGLSRQLDLAGHAIMASGNTLRFGSSSANFTVLAGGSLALGDNVTVDGSSSSGGINNYGTITKTGSGTTTFSGPALNNNGLIDVQAGTLNLNSGGSNSGTIQVEGAGLGLGGTFTMAAGSVLNDQGNLTIYGGTVTANGQTSIGGTLAVNGTLNANSGLTLSQTSLIIDGALNLNGAFSAPNLSSVYVNSGATFNTGANSLSLSNLLLTGTLSGTGNVTVTGALTWTGSMSGTGKTILGPGATLSMGGNTTLGRELDIAGQVSFANTSIAVGGGYNSHLSGTLGILSGGSITLADGVSVNDNNFGTAPSQLVNSGTLFKTGTGTSTVAVAFTNSGTVDLEGGTLNLNGGGSNSGIIRAAAGTTLQLQGAFSSATGSQLNDAGNLIVNINSGSKLNATQLSVDGALTVSSGELDINNAISPASITVSNSGILNAGASLTLANLSFNGFSAQLRGSGDVALSGTASLGGNAALFGPGKLTMAAGVALSIGSVSLGRELDISGPASIAASSSVSLYAYDSSVSAYSSGTLSILSGGTLTLAGGASIFTSSSAGGSIRNAGNLIKTGSSSSTIGSDASRFVNTGTIDIQAGALSMLGGMSNNGSMTVESGAELDLGSAVGGGGNIDVAGKLAWTGTSRNPGSLAGSGKVAIQSGGTFTAGNTNGAASLSLGEETDISGQASVTANTVLNLNVKDSVTGNEDRGTVAVLSGGSLSLADGITIGNTASYTDGELDNAGTLSKTGTGTSTVAVTLGNSGTVDVKGGTLKLTGSVSNTGAIKANGGNVVIAAAVSDGGAASITGSSFFEFGGASNETVTFTAGATGTLKLDDSQHFTGTIAALALGQNVDLADIQFATVQTPVISASGGNTNVHVTDGTHAADVILAGNYQNAIFSLVSDGTGGTELELISAASSFSETWSNANGGNWNTASNWSSNATPGAQDTVSLPLQAGETVTLGSGSPVVAQLVESGAGTFALAGGSLAVSGTTGIGGTLLVQSGTFAPNDTAVIGSLSLDGTLGGSGTAFVIAALNWATGGSAGAVMSGAGKTVLNAGASMSIGSASPTQVTLGRELDVAGTGTVAAGTTVRFGVVDGNATGGFDAGTLAVMTGGSLSLADAVTFSDASSGAVSNALSNLGTLKKTGSSISTIGVALNNLAGGTVNVQGGTLDLTGTSTNAGSITVAAGSVLKLDGAMTQSAGAQLNDAGDLISNANATLAGSVTVGGTLSVTGGTLTLQGSAAPASMSIGHGTLKANGPFASALQGSLSTQALTLNQSDSVLSGTGSAVNVNGTLSWSAGTLDQTGSGVQVKSGGTLTAGNANGAVQLGLGGSLYVYGQGIVQANTTIQFAPANGSGGYDGGNLNIQSGGTLSLADGVLLSVNPSATSSFNSVSNYGTLIKTGTGSGKIAVSFFNSGLLDVKGGTLELAGSVSNSSFNGGTLAADGGNIKIDSAFFSGGNDTIAANSQIEFVSTSYENVSFLAATGALKLDSSVNFNGSVTGFAGQDAMDLADIAFGASTTASYSGTPASGTLKVTDGAHTANVKFTGDFTSAVFSLAGDGGTGTMLRSDLILTGLTGGNAIDNTAVRVALANAAGVTNLSYQWLEYNASANAWQNVVNATGASFTPGEADEGKQLEVKLSYTDAGGNAQTRVASAGTVGDPVPSVTVTVSGAPMEGQPLTASATVTDTDSTKGSLGGFVWQSNVGTSVSPAWASAANYTYITGFAKTANVQANLIKEMPAGLFLPANSFGERFSIASDANGKNFNDALSSNGSKLTIDMAIPNVTDVYTLMNAYGPPSGSQLATVQFIGSQGATQTFTLVSGTDVRDFYQGGYANSINGTSTQNAFTISNVQDAAGSGNVNTGATGTYVVDEQDFHLSAAFATQTLQQIVITALGHGTPILLGMTAQSTETAAYTPGEGDEGASLRATVSYVDDEGRAFQFASAPTAAVADAANDEPGQPASTDRWRTNSGGTWTASDAGDWSADAVPGANDVVSFLLPAGETISYNGGATTVGQLFGDGAGTLSVAGGTLTVTGATTLQGSLAIANGAALRAHGILSSVGSIPFLGGVLALSAPGTSTLGGYVNNSGTIDVQAGALNLTGTLTNTGIIKADGGNVKIAGALTDGGNAVITGSSQLEFGAASNETVAFDANAAGSLVLDNAQTFIGTIAGVKPGDTLDLRDIAFASVQTPLFTRTSASGTLALSDGPRTSRLNFGGDLTATGFSLASDGVGGTLLRGDLTLSGLTGGNAVEGTQVSVALANGTGVSNLSYQWVEWNAGTASWQALANATTASFTPGKADEGKPLAAQLSYTDGAGQARTGFAFAGTIADVQPNVSVTVSGAVQEGQPLTANVTVSDQDGTPGSLAGVQWQVNKGTAANPAWANAGTYTYVTGFSKNSTIQSKLIKEFPNGIFATSNAFATPFNITSDTNGRNFNDALGGNGSKLTINVSIANATDVFALMDAYAPTPGRQLATVEFKASNGADQTFTLVNGTDVRDFYQGSYANTITAPTTQNAFVVANVSDGGGAIGTYVVDEQNFHLSSDFATQTLTQIIITALGNGTPLLLGMTAQSASGQTGTGTTYTPTEADEGSPVRAVATYTDDEGRALTFPSAPTVPVQDAADDETGQPTPTDSWVGGQSGVWSASDGTNWSSGAAPGASDIVSLLLPFPATVSYIAGTSTIAQLNEDGAGTLSIASGALTVIGRTAADGTLGVAAGATLALIGAVTSTIAASVTNAGTIDVQAGTLNLSGAVTSTGTIEADGGNVSIAGAVSDGGNAGIRGPSTFELQAASNEKVTFAAGASGTLLLDDSQDFTGTVAGLTAQDTLDLRDINFATVQTPTYLNATSSGETLHVTDGTHTANIALLGNYMAASFTPSSDGNGGTNLIDPPLDSSTQPPLTTPHPGLSSS